MWKISNPTSTFFCRKKIYPTNETEKALCTERHLSIENIFLKNIYRKKFPKFPKFCWLIFDPQKSKRKNRPPGACGASASSAPSALFFFYLWGDQTWKFTHSWNVTLPWQNNKEFVQADNNRKSSLALVFLGGVPKSLQTPDFTLLRLAIPHPMWGWGFPNQQTAFCFLKLTFVL